MMSETIVVGVAQNFCESPQPEPRLKIVKNSLKLQKLALISAGRMRAVSFQRRSKNNLNSRGPHAAAGTYVAYFMHLFYFWVLKL